MCRAIGCFRLLSRWQGWLSIAATPDTCGIWRSSSNSYWQPGRRAPGYNEQCAQLTAARIEYEWLAAGSQTVQQQALRDFAQAMRNFFGGTHRRPTWRKAGVHEGFRQVAVKAHHIEAAQPAFRAGVGAQGRLGAISPDPPGA